MKTLNEGPIGIWKDQCKTGILKDQFEKLEFGRTNENIEILKDQVWNF